MISPLTVYAYPHALKMWGCDFWLSYAVFIVYSPQSPQSPQGFTLYVNSCFFILVSQYVCSYITVNKKNVGIVGIVGIDISFLAFLCGFWLVPAFDFSSQKVGIVGIIHQKAGHCQPLRQRSVKPPHTAAPRYFPSGASRCCVCRRALSDYSSPPSSKTPLC